MPTIKAQKLTRTNFAPFGSVVTAPIDAPTSAGVNYRFWSDIADYRIEGGTEIGICTVNREPDAEIRGMERHLRTPEILIPIDGPFILPLLLEGKANPEAFLVNAGEAVVIGEGVWHGACIPAGNEQSSYYVIFRKGTPHDDVLKKDVSPFEISQ